MTASAGSSHPRSEGRPKVVTTARSSGTQPPGLRPAPVAAVPMNGRTSPGTPSLRAFRSQGSAALVAAVDADPGPHRSAPVRPAEAAGSSKLRVVPNRTLVRAGGPPQVRPAKPARSATWKRRLRALNAFGLFGLVLTLCFSAIAMHSQLAGRQIKLTSLRVEVDAAEREHQMLRLKVAELDTPEQVVSAAYRLGLQGATEVEFLPTASAPSMTTAGPVVPSHS